MSNSRLSKNGQVVSMWDTFTTAKTETGPHKTFDWALVGHSWSKVISESRIPIILHSRFRLSALATPSTGARIVYVERRQCTCKTRGRHGASLKSCEKIGKVDWVEEVHKDKYKSEADAVEIL